jgi:hypothetical protein
MSPLLILVMVLAANPNLGQTLSFNTTGLEACLFHVVDADGGSSLRTRDILESIVTSSGGRQLWTLSTHNDSESYGPIAKSFVLEERCSVNIIVKRESGPFGVYEMFGFRIYNLNAMIIFVLSAHHRDAVLRAGEAYDAFLRTHFFLNILGPGVNSWIEESFVFCGRCPQTHSLVVPVDPTHLFNVREFSREVRRNFHERALLATIYNSSYECHRFYPAAYRSSPGQPKVCNSAQVFIQHLAHRLNSTLEYYPLLSSLGIHHGRQEAPIGVVNVDLLSWSPYHPSLLQFFLRDTFEDRFLYCRRRVERESFSFFFWVVPFDAWGWALLVVSLFGLTLVSKGEWLDVFGALLVRQCYSTLDKKKSLILFIFAAVVVTCGYESIISSYLIVPPPIIVARRLKDLVDAGYAILGWDNRTAHRSIYRILLREKIHHSSVNEPPFIPNTATINSLQTWRLLSNCNATNLERSTNHIEFYQLIMDRVYPGLGIRCHFVKETRKATEDLITYSGYFSNAVHTFVSSFQESGILDMLYGFEEYARRLQLRIQIAKKNEAEQKAEIPFEIRDPKILSIFIAWGGLLVGASLAFLIESLFSLLNHFFVYP